MEEGSRSRKKLTSNDVVSTIAATASAMSDAAKVKGKKKTKPSNDVVSTIVSTAIAISGTASVKGNKKAKPNNDVVNATASTAIAMAGTASENGNKKAKLINDVVCAISAGIVATEDQNMLLEKDKIKAVSKELGITKIDCTNLMEKTGWSVEEVSSNLKYLILGTGGAVYSEEVILEGIKNAGIYEKLADSLGSLNTMRGGTKGFKGFVFENLHSAEATIKGQTTIVINNNGIADFKIVSANGKVKYAQAKLGYANSKIDLSPYKGQTIVVDKGNTALIKCAKDSGLKVIESDVPASEAKRVADYMQLETKITGSSKAVVVPKVNAAVQVAKEAHNAGLSSAKVGAQLGGGFSLGKNMVDVLSGDKNVKEAAGDVAVDTVVSGCAGYVVGATVTAVGNTAAGAAIGATATSVAGGLTAAVGSTSAGVAALGAGASALATGSAAVGAVGAMGTTVVTSTIAAGAATGSAVAAGAATLGSAVAGTTAGGAVIAAGTAVGTAVAGTAVGGAAIAAGTAVAGAAAVAAAPVVAVATAAGALYSLGKKLFGK